MKVDKESQTKTKKFFETDFFIDETNHYLLLDKISDNLELSEIINEHFEGDEIDGFKEKIKELVKKILSVIKWNVDSSGGENSSKKSGFVKAIIRIFSILLNANLNSVKKVSKTIKQSAKLVLRLWLERSSLSEGLPQD